MRTATFLAAFSLVAIMAGCVRSLHPLFTEEELIFEPALLGTWAGEETEDTWTFQRSGDKAYDLIVTEEGTPALFDAQLGRLGTFLFLDLYPQEPEMENEFYEFHLFPVHTFSRIWIDGDTLRLSMLDNDWLRDMIEEKKVNVGHEQLDDAIILTAPTRTLQQLVLQFAEDEGAFPQPGEMHRQD